MHKFNSKSRLPLAIAWVALACSCNTAFGQMSPVAKETGVHKTVGFDQVKPILRKRCQNCHNPEELRGDLGLNDMTAINAGSSSGPVVVPGKPRESLLYTTAAHLDEPKMPPNSRKIPRRELEVLKLWIEDGLVMKSGDLPTRKEPSEVDSAAEEMKSTGPEKPTAGESSLEQVRPLLQNTPIASMATQPNGTLVAIPGDQQIVLWDSSNRQFFGAIAFPETEITQLSFSRDGKTLVAAGGLPGLSASVFGFDPTTAKERFRLADENDSILGLDLSPNGELVALGGPSKLLKICRVHDGSVVHTHRKHTDWVLVAKFSPDGLLVASADRFGGLFVWETETGELFQALKAHTGPVHSLAWDTDGETLLSGGEDGQIRVWNLHHGELTAHWDAGVDGILSLDHKAGLTVAGGRNGLVKAWRAPDQCLGTYEAPEQIEAVAVFENAKQLVSTDSTGSIHLLRLPDLTLVKSTSLPADDSAHPSLIARLERKSQEYTEMLREENKERLLAEQRMLAQQDTPAPAEMQLATNTDFAVSLQRELELVQTNLDRQIAVRETTEQQLALLESQLQTQTALVESTREQLKRLTELQRLAQSSLTAGSISHDEKSRVLNVQLEDQNAMREAIASLQKRALESAETATRLPAPTRPDWDATIELLEQLADAIHSQSLATEAALESVSSINE